MVEIKNKNFIKCIKAKLGNGSQDILDLVNTTKPENFRAYKNQILVKDLRIFYSIYLGIVIDDGALTAKIYNYFVYNFDNVNTLCNDDISARYYCRESDLLDTISCYNDVEKDRQKCFKDLKNFNITDKQHINYKKLNKHIDNFKKLVDKN